MDNENLPGVKAKPWRNVSKYGFALPDLLAGIWVSCGAGFQQLFDLNSDDDCINLVFWWVSIGRNEFPGVRDVLDADLVHQLHFAHIGPDYAFKKPTPLMSLIYQNRADVRAAFDICDADNFVGFWCWWLNAGLGEYFIGAKQVTLDQIKLILDLEPERYDGFDRQIDSIRFGALQSIRLLPFPTTDTISTLFNDIHFDHLRNLTVGMEDRPSPLMMLIYRNRTDLQEAFPSVGKGENRKFWEWWFASDLSEFLANNKTFRIDEAFALLANLGEKVGCFDGALAYQAFLKLSVKGASQKDEFARLLDDIHFSLVETSRENGELTPLMRLIYRNRVDLQELFPVGLPTLVEDIYHWWDETGHSAYGVMEFPYSPSEVLPVGSANVQTVEGGVSISLVGYPRGEFGLGEDIRLLRASLQTVGIQPDVIRVPWKITAREGISEPIIEADEAEFGSDVMIYVMPAFDTLTLLNKVGPRAFSARRKIGYWQWELSKFPETALMAFDLIDEIWCHSKHSAKAFRAATDKPVIEVPLPVKPPVIERVARSAFNLKEQSFVVFTSFDGASSISRKNPMAAILAFQKAFPRGEYPQMQLVVKAMNALDDGLWRDCVRKSYLDDRIQIKNEVLDRGAYYQLLACCDVVLSMHRAEGFGRLMAEAMAIGVPVIATGYSGNLDFMTQDNSWLISGQNCKLVPGDYPFYKGQEWMEPDIDEAAGALRDCYIDRAKRERFVTNAKETLERYSLQSCGEEYLKLLHHRL
ncbi:glycosyltransferase [Rhizobium sp. CG4]|uniref:glycosyltransferase family 4 protein n=1 Tax=Rhizobium sp. CG4 TaxID=2726075 RepID=UPI002033CA6F|nr:glycosyltransferase [Rhizobium sp. CG4]MCM2458017.1 glycosyltransferase [Rhizobium sp. CG4]